MFRAKGIIMKKCFTLVICISNIFVHAAENAQPLRLDVNGTQFYVIKGPIYKRDSDLMVLGRNQQRKLEPPAYNDSSEVGRIFFEPDNRRMRVVDADADSASDDDTYKFFGLKIEDFRHEKAHDQDVTSEILLIVEPRIILYPYEIEVHPGYVPQREHTMYRFYADEAIKEACKDLGMCFQVSLRKGLEILRDKPNKNISFNALGTDVGIPREKAAPATFDAIIEFIQNNPNAYTAINLFVKKRSDFEKYRKLMKEYNDQK
jgi:hypothetical protein